MIDEKKLSELRELHQTILHDPQSDCSVFCANFPEFADTLSALWQENVELKLLIAKERDDFGAKETRLLAVARAAEDIADQNSKVGWDAIPSHGDYLSRLFAALAALKEKA